jgi:hypothetical protein
MIFILVEVVEPINAFAGYRKWRATHVKPDGNAIDIFFWARNETDAQEHIRKHYPSATFTRRSLKT